jgi:hypothetical protein
MSWEEADMTNVDFISSREMAKKNEEERTGDGRPPVHDTAPTLRQC